METKTIFVSQQQTCTNNNNFYIIKQHDKEIKIIVDLIEFLYFKRCNSAQNG